MPVSIAANRAKSGADNTTSLAAMFTDPIFTRYKSKFDLSRFIAGLK